MAHKKQSNKLRRVKVIQTEASADSDEVSSLDSYTESLKSEDVFTGTMETENDPENESQGKKNITIKSINICHKIS